MAKKKGLGKQATLKEAQQTVEEIADMVLKQHAPPGTPGMKELKEKAAEKDNDYVEEKPSTESAGRSPVTGQTADESQDKPGQ